MIFTKTYLNGTVAIYSIVLALFSEAKCAAVITVFESGQDIIVLGSGTLNLSGLTLFGEDSDSVSGLMNGGNAAIAIGQGGYALYEGSTGPQNFGATQIVWANYSEGDIFGVGAQGRVILVPFLYSSGAPLLATSTWRESSIISLGLRPGLYTYTWNTGTSLSNESLTINIIPEPSSFCVLGSIFLMATLRRSRA